MIHTRDLIRLPFRTLRKLAEQLSRDIDAGEHDKRTLLERVFNVIAAQVKQ